MTEPDLIVQGMVARIRKSRKYQGLDLPDSTLYDLIQRELEKDRRHKKAEANVREKLHQIVAPYLGDPDYAESSQTLSAAAADGSDALDQWALSQLESHASTRERIPIMKKFYEQIFAHTFGAGHYPRSIGDLACGMNPFAIRWMNLPSETDYFAYDLHAPRVALIDRFFKTIGKPNSSAFHGDILVDPPKKTFDMVFFFKEAHRFEARRKGSSKTFFQQLSTEWIIVSLPQQNLTGDHSMRDRQTALIEKSVAGTSWSVSEFTVGNEMIFCIKK